MTSLHDNQVVVTGASFVRADRFDSESVGSQTFETYNLHNHLPKKGLRFRSESARLFCSNAFEAVRVAEFGAVMQDRPDRVGVYHATELANLEDVFDFDLTAKNDGPANVSPMRAPNTLANVASGEFSIQTGITGPNVTVSSGFTSGLTALDVAMWHLEDAQTDGALVGSVDVHSHYHQRLWEAENGHGDTPLAPEMAAAIVLERADSAKERQAHVLCALVGSAAGHAGGVDQSPAERVLSILGKAQSRVPEGGADTVNTLIICAEEDNGLSNELAEIWARVGDTGDLPKIEVLARKDAYGDNTHGLEGVSRAFDKFETLSDSASGQRIAVVALDRRGICSSVIFEKV